MVSKSYKREFKKKVTKVLEFYHWSVSRWKKDPESREIARQGDVLTAEILALINDRVEPNIEGQIAAVIAALINDRVEPNIEGQIAAVIAIIQSYAFLRESVAYVEEDPDKLMEAFTKLFMSDFWRWVKHDHVQSYYEMFFMGDKFDSEKFVETIKNMHSYDKKNYK